MNWISAEKVLKRWDAVPRELRDAVEAGLTPYQEYQKGPLIVKRDDFLKAFDNNPEGFTDNYFSVVLFNIDDLLKFENEYGYGPVQALDGKEKQKLGRLSREKENWDLTILAAVEAGLFVKNGKKVVKRAELQDMLFRKFPKLTHTSFERIWSSIPVNYKKSAGRPSEKKKE